MQAFFHVRWRRILSQRPTQLDNLVVSGEFSGMARGSISDELWLNLEPLQPQGELGIGCCGMTCQRSVRHWQASGVWVRLHQALLSKLRVHDRLDWIRASIDSASVASPRVVKRQGRTRPTVESLAASVTLS